MASLFLTNSKPKMASLFLTNSKPKITDSSRKHMVFPEGGPPFQFLHQGPALPAYCIVPRVAAKKGAAVKRRKPDPPTHYWMPTLNPNWLRKLVFSPFICDGVEEKVYDLAVMCTTRLGNTMLFWLDGSATHFVQGKPEFIVAEPLEVLDAGVILQVLDARESSLQSQCAGAGLFLQLVRLPSFAVSMRWGRPLFATSEAPKLCSLNALGQASFCN